MLRLLSLLAGLLFSAPVLSAADSLQAFLDRASSISATFQQRLLDERGSQLEMSSGSMLLSRPGRFRWEYTEPYVQQIIGDGSKVWIYDADLEQVSVRRMDSTLRGSPAVLLSTTERVDSLFAVSERGEMHGMDWVELKPLETDTSFTLLAVGMRDGLLAAMRLTDTFGQTTELYFADVEVNEPVSDERFEFTPPPGVDVIDETASAPRQ